jgi:putative two-component system response regulator
MEKVIFVVDDADTSLQVTKEALSNKYTVHTISSGERALKMLDKVVPHLILLDIDMPEMDGFEVMEHLMSNEIYTQIPVIFLSAMKDQMVIQKSFGLGAVDFVRKPFDAATLLEKVRAHIT